MFHAAGYPAGKQSDYGPFGAFFLYGVRPCHCPGAVRGVAPCLRARVLYVGLPVEPKKSSPRSWSAAVGEPDRRPAGRSPPLPGGAALPPLGAC